MVSSLAVDLAPGSRLRHYVLERLIGAGGMGVVWAARDESAGRAVALKILNSQGSASPDSRRRFLREARASRAIGHPAVVPAIEVMEHEDSLILAMDLLFGETLRGLLNREERLPVATAASVLLPIAEALSVAHRSGIAHRDLKPENIFLQTAQHGVRPRLLDFGIARFYEPQAGHSSLTPITGVGMLLGTLPYMAPEQAMSSSECDHGVDAWGLGVILYEALSGCRPIEGNTPPELMRQLLVGGITPLSVMAPDVPADLGQLVSGLLSRDRGQRLDCRVAAERLARHAAA